MFPVSNHVPFEYNPLKTVWFPAAIADEVLLHTILFSTTLHLSAALGDTSKNPEVLMKVILDRLNARMKTRLFSDATIGAISCLALCDNQAGNHANWAMHMAGMSEMIRFRGGVGSIYAPMQMKIYRADILGAVDTLSRPRLPRPVRTTRSLYHAMKVGLPSNQSLLSMLLEIGPSQTLFDIFVDMSMFSESLCYAADQQTPVSTQAYEEDAICIQQDLLATCQDQPGSLERTLSLAALIFMQMLMRERPFLTPASTLISKELKASLLASGTGTLPAALGLWVNVMGGLVSTRTNESDWYRHRLWESSQRDNSLANWQTAKCQLQTVMWIECIQDEYGAKLWHEIHGPICLSVDGTTA
jgi:hypothetical protein